MTTTLVSFLGKSATHGYQETNYEFEGGHKHRSRYFALALLDRFRAAKVKVDALVLLGTSGSMWDVFSYDNADFKNANSEALAHLDALTEKAPRSEVAQSDVDAVAPALSQLLGIKVIPHIIPRAQTSTEQMEILRIIGDVTSGAKQVYLDVTHGFRHLPMLGLASSRFLSILRDVKVAEIFYGAFEMKSNDASPVVRLGGLDRLLDGVEALATFDHSGDYGAFADHLGRSGVSPSVVQALREAAFFERQSNPSSARAKLVTVMQDLERWSDESLRLLKPELERRISWAKNPNRSHWELSLAERYLQSRDYVRAAIYCQEGLISRHCETHLLDSNDRNDRDKARETLRRDVDDFVNLSNVRNVFAHGFREENKRTKSLLASEATLQGFLRKFLANLAR
jgi:CRISPR-associated Csx2 family protein